MNRADPWEVRQRAAMRRAALPDRTDTSVVYVDASWRDGVGGLAVVGALGVHTECVPCGTNNAAEVLALGLAMRIARDRLIPGDKNRHADRVARRARLGRVADLEAHPAPRWTPT